MKIKNFFRGWNLFFSILALVVVLYYAFDYFVFYTSDAFLDANVISMSTQVPGSVKAIYVQDNDAVRQGELLLDLDSLPYEHALSQAQADLLSAQQARQKLIDATAIGQAQIDSMQAKLKFLQDEWERVAPLVKQGALSKQKGSQTFFALKEGEANYLQAVKQLNEIQQQMGKTENDFGPIALAKAKIAQAEYDLSQTHLYAPSNGYITNFFVRPGQYLHTGDATFALVETDNIWVIARFKETTLRKIHPGSKVKISVDIYPFHLFNGVVQSIGWGVNRHENSPSAARSALPYVEQTEYWIRLAQRFPVKITITDPDPAHYPLRVGANARVFVLT